MVHTTRLFDEHGNYIGKTRDQARDKIQACEDGINACKKEMMEIIKNMKALRTFTLTE